MLDFSASVNPFPPRVSWKLDPGVLAAYPDDTYAKLKDRISSVFHRPPEEICVGNGSIEIIRAFCAVIFRYSDLPKTYFLDSPTFGEYALSARLAGATRVPGSATVSFLCNPNNPTGRLLSRDNVLATLDGVKTHGGILFCDEAFIELADPEQSVTCVRDSGLFVLRSLTKCFAVPGIRFGYGFGDADLIRKIETMRSPWSVNAYAEAYAMEALGQMKELAASRDAIETERTFLSASLQNLGLNPSPSHANYMLVDCGREVSSLCRSLSAQGILVRDCTSFGLPTHIRIAVRTRDENQILIEALTACVH